MADASDAQTKPRRKWSTEKWLAAYAEHGTVTAACKVIGISRETAYATRKVDEEFAADWDKQENAVTDLLEKTLVEVALDFKHSGQVRALTLALKSRRPSKYRESIKMEHGGKITTGVEEGVDEAIRAQLAENERLRDRLAELEPAGKDEVPSGA